MSILLNKINRMGPGMEACGIPNSTGNSEDLQSI